MDYHSHPPIDQDQNRMYNFLHYLHYYFDLKQQMKKHYSIHQSLLNSSGLNCCCQVVYMDYHSHLPKPLMQDHSYKMLQYYQNYQTYYSQMKIQSFHCCLLQLNCQMQELSLYYLSLVHKDSLARPAIHLLLGHIDKFPHLNYLMQEVNLQHCLYCQMRELNLHYSNLAHKDFPDHPPTYL